MEHFVGGHVIQDQANGFRGIEGAGNRYKSIRRNNCVAAISAGHDESGDTLANCELANSVAKSVDLTDDVVAWSKRKLWSVWVKAVSHQNISKGNAGGQDFHTNLARAGLGQIFFDPLQNLGTAQSRYHDPSIFWFGHPFSLSSTEITPLAKLPECIYSMYIQRGGEWQSQGYLNRGTARQFACRR